MDFAVWRGEGLTVVTAPPEIDLTNAGLLRAALESAARDRPPVIVVDLSGTEFCDSSGLNALVRAQQQAAGQGRGLRLVVGTPAVHRMLAVTGTAGLFRLCDNIEQALRPD
jgi:anti-sigma B factor antagonist